MCFMSGSIEMENVYIPENEVGVWQWFFGKTITSVVFRNPGPSDGFVGIAAPSLARILPVCAFTNLQNILIKPCCFSFQAFPTDESLFINVTRDIVNTDGFGNV